jgi:spartin
MLLLSGVNYATNYYIKHSEPSSKHSSPATSSSSLATTSKASRSRPSVHGAVIVKNSKTRTALVQAHAISGTAVKISGKTIELVDSLIKKAVGAENSKSKPERLHPPVTRPPYMPQSNPGYTERGEGPPPLPPRLHLRKRDRIILSADLILSTIEESARQFLDAGQSDITQVLTHK